MGFDCRSSYSPDFISNFEFFFDPEDIDKY